MSRSTCLLCRKAQIMCYCEAVESFESFPHFVILLHPRESRKAINTGRMAFRHLNNALLIVDSDFSENVRLNELLSDPSKRFFVLFPGPKAMDLADVRKEYLAEPTPQEAVFIILDATWHMAKKMFYASKNLHGLQQVSFEPTQPSRFRIREQPNAAAYSTLETVHYLIDYFGAHPEGEHHQMLKVFEKMVAEQVDFEIKNKGK